MNILKNRAMTCAVNIHAIFILLFVFIILIPDARAAPDNKPALFFTALADVPAMHGLIELEDYTLVYDKPEGRIIEMVARLENNTIESVTHYYQATLPEFGWQALHNNNYVRGAEHLIISYESRDGRDYVRFTVQPQ
jgi:hypothetical protein